MLLLQLTQYSQSMQIANKSFYFLFAAFTNVALARNLKANAEKSKHKT